MPRNIPKNVTENINANKTEFFKDLKAALNFEKDNLFILVDKKHFLPENYAPKDLVLLNSNRSYITAKDGLYLTKTAERALQQMAEAARKDGVTLVVSSTYRPYEYQKKLFTRYIKEYGEKQAETFSARAGTSQHQLGTVIDFGSISDEYAETRAGKWLAKNASAYGWSLSFPKGFDNVTGYKWECWHFRYLGIPACRLQKKWFDDIQQYMLEFIDLWKKSGLSVFE